MATRTQELYTITLHWLDGTENVLEGWGENDRQAAADAMRSAGYGAGALRALDYFSATIKLGAAAGRDAHGKG